jgi:hypothetical protein
VKAVPPPLTPQWLPRVFAHADSHGAKVTASNLTSSLVPSDAAITTWQQRTQQVGVVSVGQAHSTNICSPERASLPLTKPNNQTSVSACLYSQAGRTAAWLGRRVSDGI